VISALSQLKFDVSYFAVDEMIISEIREFITWYYDQKNKDFDNIPVLEK
jgi:hypothetical protein